MPMPINIGHWTWIGDWWPIPCDIFKTLSDLHKLFKILEVMGA